MAMTEMFPGVAAMRRAESAWRTPLGAVSPLWLVFGAAAGAGMAYWWMTQWTRTTNIEAFGAAPAPEPERAKPVAKRRPPLEIIADPIAEPPSAEVVEATPVPAVEAIADAAEPSVAAADDLTRMVGIGPKLAAALAERGVTHFAQIAAWTADDVAETDAALGLRGRAVREAWVAQAKRLASGS